MQTNNKSTLGQRTAEHITCIVGSWKFILFQTALLFVWIVLNSLGILTLDSHPFIFLTLLLSIQAAYAAPVILMSQNMAAERDRKKFEIDLATDRKAEREIEEIQLKLEKMDKEKLSKILEILNSKKQ